MGHFWDLLFTSGNECSLCRLGSQYQLFKGTPYLDVILATMVSCLCRNAYELCCNSRCFLIKLIWILLMKQYCGHLGHIIGSQDLSKAIDAEYKNTLLCFWQIILQENLPIYIFLIWKLNSKRWRTTCRTRACRSSTFAKAAPLKIIWPCLCCFDNLHNSKRIVRHFH